MAKQIIRGRNVSCRDCVYVRNPRFPLHVEDSVLRSRPSESYRVTCCRRAPPVTFDWTHVDIDPFCGEFDDGTEGICNAAPVEKRCGTCANLDREYSDDGRYYCEPSETFNAEDGPPWDNCRFWQPKGGK